MISQVKKVNVSIRVYYCCYEQGKVTFGWKNELSFHYNRFGWLIIYISKDGDNFISKKELEYVMGDIHDDVYIYFIEDLETNITRMWWW